MTHIYYLLLLVITALGSSLMTMYLPYLKRVIKRYKTRLTRPKVSHQAQMVTLAKKVVELEKQVNNLAARLANKEHNITQKINRQIDKKIKEILND